MWELISRKIMYSERSRAALWFWEGTSLNSLYFHKYELSFQIVTNFYIRTENYIYNWKTPFDLFNSQIWIKKKWGLIMSRIIYFLKILPLYFIHRNLCFQLFWQNYWKLAYFFLWIFEISLLYIMRSRYLNVFSLGISHNNSVKLAQKRFHDISFLILEL